jgi:rhodanese-related sulfurtransferase
MFLCPHGTRLDAAQSSDTHRGGAAMSTVVDLVTRAKSQIENLTPEQVAQEVEEGAVLVDLREPAELSNDGTIEGAVHAPRGMLEFYADPTSPYHRAEFDPGRRTILFCASGGRSALGAQALAQLGYGDVAHLDGGLKAWRGEGRPTVPPPA